MYESCSNTYCDFCGRKMSSDMEIFSDLGENCSCQLQELAKNLVEFIYNKDQLISLILQLKKTLPESVMMDNFNMK